MGVATTLCWVPVLLGLSIEADADQPPPPDAPDACHPIQQGDSLVEARILSFEQPRYSCGPYQGTTPGWTEILVSLDPQHAPLRPTAKAGCILADTHMVVLDDRALDSLPSYNRTPATIELRVDGAARTVHYRNMWEICDLAPKHHVVEMDTDRGPLICEGDVRTRETLTLAARSYGAILHIEPTRLIGGAPLGQQLSVEYDSFNFGPDAYQPHYDAFPASAILRVWTSADGVLRAEQCPFHAETSPKKAPQLPTRPNHSPRPAPPGGCAHCAAETSDPSSTLFAALVVALFIVRRRS